MNINPHRPSSSSSSSSSSSGNPRNVNNAGVTGMANQAPAPSPSPSPSPSPLPAQVGPAQNHSAPANPNQPKRKFFGINLSNAKRSIANALTSPRKARNSAKDTATATTPAPSPAPAQAASPSPAPAPMTANNAGLAMPAPVASPAPTTDVAMNLYPSGEYDSEIDEGDAGWKGTTLSADSSGDSDDAASDASGAEDSAHSISTAPRSEDDASMKDASGSQG